MVQKLTRRIKKDWKEYCNNSYNHKNVFNNTELKFDYENFLNYKFNTEKRIS